MHVLIIPGEELNPSNIYSSVFELHQATALRNHTSINCGFISINLQGNFFEEIKKLFTFRISIKSFISFLKTKKVSFTSIQEFNCVEASSFFVWSGKLRTKYQEQAKVGLRAYNSYVKKFGKPDLIHAHSRFLTGGVIAQAIKGRYQIPYVLTEHSTYYARGLVTAAELKIVQSVINHAACWICVSPKLGDTVTNMVQGLNKPYKYVPNVIDGLFEDVETVNFKPSPTPFKFINIASLDEKKAHGNLIQAFADRFQQNTNFQLYIAGSGPLENSLKKLAVKLGVEEQVFFLGQLNRDDIKQCLQQSNAFVLSSTYETFGVVLIEALACGKPVIATACGGPENIVTENNGYLVEVNNIAALSYAMQNMVTNYPQFNGQKIRKNCIENFGSKSFATKMQQIYNSISLKP